jgi:hypothetical protein
MAGPSRAVLNKVSVYDHIRTLSLINGKVEEIVVP